MEQQKCLQHVVRELRKISVQELDKRDKASKKLQRDDIFKSREETTTTDHLKKRGRPAKQPKALSFERREKLEEIMSQSEKASRQAMKFNDFFKKAWKKDGSDMSVYTPLEQRISTAKAEE